MKPLIQRTQGYTTKIKKAKAVWVKPELLAEVEYRATSEAGGQYEDPVRVVALNIAEGWCREVSAEFAEELQQRADRERHELTGKLAEFVIHHTRQT